MEKVTTTRKYNLLTYILGSTYIVIIETKSITMKYKI